MKKIKNILKLLVFIIIIKTSFWVSFAFLWGDLGFDLYKEIDKWATNLEVKNYKHDLKWWKAEGKISDEINRVLELKWYWKCRIEKDISLEEFEKIASWNGLFIKNKLSKECWDDISILNWIVSTISDLRILLKSRAERKTEKTFHISRMWIYTDWSLDNSPFDLVKDIRDIDYIIFTNEIPYEWYDSIDDNDFNNHVNWLLNDFYNKKYNRNNYRNNLLDGDDSEILNDNSNNTLINDNVLPIPSYLLNQDQTNYLCPQDNSWLDLSDNKTLLLNKNSLNNSNIDNSNRNNYSNDNEIPFKDLYRNIPKKLEDLNWDYFKVTDDSLWDCTRFFCIDVEFITYNHSLFWGSTTRSIQSIVERSNKHLKSIVNTSLVQWKMTSDNFELWLRDLNLSDIFSMWMVVTKKTPPILNLEQHQKDPEKIKKNDKFSVNNNFCRRWEALWWKCRRENDLSVFAWMDKEQKILNNTSELEIKELSKRLKWVESENQKDKKIYDFVTKAIINDAQKNETEYLYKEFVELERFTKSMQEYTVTLKKDIEMMLEIPIHP